MIKVDGKKIRERLKGEIRDLLSETGPKSLAIIYVGENPVIDSYVALKKRFGEELGITVDVLRFSADVAESDLLQEIAKAASKYSGMIVQLPLPESLDKEKVLNAVPTALDVDVLASKSFEGFSRGEIKKLPPVVAAVAEIVREYEVDLSSKKIVIVGQGPLVGRPVGAWLGREGFAYEFFERRGDVELLKSADVIISGAGVPGLVTASVVKEGAILIDAGTSTSSGKIAGDIDPAAYEKASLVSGVPGGVGPITVASLFKNLFL